ncbi:MAG TPA: hypothetical protein PK156_33180 [Polyangium sp.]|nr:hypothetical protein [Polyangium sp.]
MNYRSITAILGLSSLLLAGCGSGLTVVHPRVLGPHELYLQYDNEFQIASPEGMVATGLRYDGLTEYVGCVPQAARHAEAAESSGNAAVGLTAAGIGLGIGGLGGLAGLAFPDNQDLMATFLLAGLGAEVVGLVLTAVGRATKVDANGHAVDAVNFYNDAVGSRGGRCGPRGAEIPQPPPAAASPQAPIYPVPPNQIPPPPPVKPWPVQTSPAPPDRVMLPQ